MINLSFLNQIGVFFIDVVGFCLAAWVLLSNYKNKINKYFALMVFSYLSWISFYYFMRLPNQTDYAFLWARLGFAGVFIFLTFLYFFSLFFLKEGKRFLILNKFVLGMGIISSFLSLFTEVIVKRMEATNWGLNPILSDSGKIIFFSFVVFISIFILIQFFKKYLRVSIRQEKLKIQYILLGFILLIVINLFFNVFLPLKMGDFQYSYFGNYSLIFFLGFTAYAIVKQELFGIRVVLTALFVGSIAILLLLDTLFLTPQLIFQLFKGLTLVIFLFFGYSLIQSVIREIQRRAELQQLYEEVDRLNRAKSEFISIASHQLRTPLTAIKGYISMIIEGTYGKIASRLSQPLKNVYQGNERLIRLVNDLLNLSRLEAGRIEFSPKRISLEKIVSGVVDDLSITAKEKNLYIKVKTISSLPQIMADEDKLRQVILNILDNAIKYTQKGGITIELGKIDSRIQIKISDTGEGMTKEEIKSLFQMFSRATAGAQLHIEGAGIGLYVAKKFIEMHQGKVWAQSKGKGQGSAFYIELPVSFG